MAADLGGEWLRSQKSNRGKFPCSHLKMQTKTAPGKFQGPLLTVVPQSFGLVIVQAILLTSPIDRAAWTCGFGCWKPSSLLVELEQERRCRSLGQLLDHRLGHSHCC